MNGMPYVNISLFVLITYGAHLWFIGKYGIPAQKNSVIPVYKAGGGILPSEQGGRDILSFAN